MGRSRRTAVGVALAVLVLAGCGGGDESSADATASSAPSSSSERGGGSGTAQAADLDKALARVQVKAVQPPDGDLEIALLEAKVVGKLLRVRIAYAPTFDVQKVNAYELAGEHDPAPYLVDGANLKRYNVVRAKGKGPVESDVVFTRGNDEQPIVLTHYFAAPPEGVDTLSLSFAGAPWPGFDVTVSR